MPRKPSPRIVVSTKLCRKCSVTKPAKSFYKCSRNVDSLTSYCKACLIRYQVNYNRKRRQQVQNANNV